MGSKTTLLERAYHWESTKPDEVWLTQPTGGGAVVDYSWRSALDEARRMASHLRALGLPPRSQIALLGKNSAHWILADLAIWMAGHVTVPIYPTLTAETVKQIALHSEARLIFVGRLDGWETMKAGLPPALPGIALPLAPKTTYESWNALVAKAKPLVGRPARDPAEMATIHYTSGSTGTPKGVMLSFDAMHRAVEGLEGLFPSLPGDRSLSYLPLAHALERVAVESLSIERGTRIFFSDTLHTFVKDLQDRKSVV
jgi:long-chain acyl-CoA synthetase